MSAHSSDGNLAVATKRYQGSSITILLDSTDPACATYSQVYVDDPTGFGVPEQYLHYMIVEVNLGTAQYAYDTTTGEKKVSKPNWDHEEKEGDDVYRNGLHFVRVMVTHLNSRRSKTILFRCENGYVSSSRMLSVIKLIYWEAMVTVLSTNSTRINDARPSGLRASVQWCKKWSLLSTVSFRTKETTYSFKTLPRIDLETSNALRHTSRTQKRNNPKSTAASHIYSHGGTASGCEPNETIYWSAERTRLTSAISLSRSMSQCLT